MTGRAMMRISLGLTIAVLLPGQHGRLFACKEQYRKELQQLEEAFKQGDTEKLGQLIAAIKKRLDSAPNPARGGRAVRTEPDKQRGD